MKHRFWIWFVSGGLIVGCAGSYGRLSYDKTAEAFFMETTVRPGYRYYYLNQESSPYAVAAVEDRYRITGPLWRNFDPRSPVYERVVGLVEAFPSRSGGAAHGAFILDAEGKKIGYWYSGLNMINVAVDKAAGTIRIATEMPWVGGGNGSEGFESEMKTPGQ